jgi:hypothetical protein
MQYIFSPHRKKTQQGRKNICGGKEILSHTFFLVCCFAVLLSVVERKHDEFLRMRTKKLIAIIDHLVFRPHVCVVLGVESTEQNENQERTEDA